MGSVRSPDTRGPDRPVDRPTSAGCDLVRQDCGVGRGCYPGVGGNVCLQAGSLSEDTPCLDHDACAPGHLCVDVFGAGSSSLCERVCDLTAANTCPAGRPCQVFAAGTVGYCAP